MSCVAANSVVGHDDSDDDAKGAEDEEGEGEGDLLDGRAVADGVGSIHHDILVGDGEGVVNVRHRRGWERKRERSCQWLDGIGMIEEERGFRGRA